MGTFCFIFNLIFLFVFYPFFILHAPPIVFFHFLKLFNCLFTEPDSLTNFIMDYFTRKTKLTAKPNQLIRSRYLSAPIHRPSAESDVSFISPVTTLSLTEF